MLLYKLVHSIEFKQYAKCGVSGSNDYPAVFVLKETSLTDKLQFSLLSWARTTQDKVQSLFFNE